MPSQRGLSSHSQQVLVFGLFLQHNYCKVYGDPKGPQAARWRQRKFQLLRQIAMPPDLLPGALTETHSKCGKAGCHCSAADDAGHVAWTLTFMSEGKRRVERIPREWVDSVRSRVQAGREFQDAVREVLTANAELLVLARKQKRKGSR
jgi:hypothetical protein